MGTEPAFRRVPSIPRLIPLGVVGLSTLALTAAAVFGASQPESAVAACPGQFTLDFNGLPAGTILAEQYAGFGVHISGTANDNPPEDFPNALIVFDTNAPPTHDPDLAVDIGNIAIFAKNLNDANGNGLVDDPDENNFGGRAVFAFDQDVSIGSVLWVDKDAGHDNFVVAYNAAGEVITSVPVPRGANASVQRIEINADGVRRLEFVYRESGGFTGIEVACAQATPTPAGTSTGQTPAPTAGPSPAPAVAAASATPAAPAVLAAALPAGGGSPGTGGSFSWVGALLASTIVAGTAFALVLKVKR